MADARVLAGFRCDSRSCPFLAPRRSSSAWAAADERSASCRCCNSRVASLSLSFTGSDLAVDARRSPVSIGATPRAAWMRACSSSAFSLASMCSFSSACDDRSSISTSCPCVSLPRSRMSCTRAAVSSSASMKVIISCCCCRSRASSSSKAVRSRRSTSTSARFSASSLRRSSTWYWSSTTRTSSSACSSARCSRTYASSCSTLALSTAFSFCIAAEDIFKRSWLRCNCRWNPAVTSETSRSRSARSVATSSCIALSFCDRW
mmetsp:Transcript_46644/g.143837  ORF Transcript_46644/g.143837 Transcript_46644/m.143837 type:complete len:262 (-) Transcript_46644:279-1064(-)